jgi:ribosomal protein S18 acetylase RimI-like enzyme
MRQPEVRTHTRAEVPQLIDAISAWEPEGGYVTGLHAGDLGWHLRLPDELLADTIHSWWRDGRLVALALIEGPAARPRLAPDCLHDPVVCGAVAEALDAMDHPQCWSDARPDSLLRAELVARGWRLDPDPWVALHVDLTRTSAPQIDGVGPTGTDVDARVAVQRAGFERSTFTADAWHRMAEGPRFRPELDLVARDPDGVPVAVATAWTVGLGRCGILEPVATSAEHRGKGHGRRVVRAALAALAAAGASGASVATPGGNDPAVALYESAGMRQIERLQGLVRG